jgi:hypothetical protein
VTRDHEPELVHGESDAVVETVPAIVAALARDGDVAVTVTLEADGWATVRVRRRDPFGWHRCEHTERVRLTRGDQHPTMERQVADLVKHTGAHRRPIYAALDRARRAAGVVMGVRPNGCDTGLR